jgi:hypothetical protein
VKSVDLLAVGLELLPLLGWWVSTSVDTRVGFLMLLVAGLGWWRIRGLNSGLQAAVTRFGVLSTIFLFILCAWFMYLIFDLATFEDVAFVVGWVLFYAMLVTTIISAVLVAVASVSERESYV